MFYSLSRYAIGCDSKQTLALYVKNIMKKYIFTSVNKCVERDRLQIKK